jgi:hypothetical protein
MRLTVEKNVTRIPTHTKQVTVAVLANIVTLGKFLNVGCKMLLWNLYQLYYPFTIVSNSDCL